MKIVTFKGSESSDGYRIGKLVSGSEIVDLSHLVSEGSLSAAEVLSCFDLDAGFNDQAERSTGEVVSLDAIRLCAPVPRPGKIICIGLNYRDHAAESGMPIPSSPVIFSKFTTCTIGPGESIAVPPGSAETDYEAELAFIIGRRAKNVGRDNALDHVFG